MLALQLVMDWCSKLNRLNLLFLAARNAILAADVALTGGANQLEIWTAFLAQGWAIPRRRQWRVPPR